MRATLKGHLIAESDDIVESGGYHYFPSSAVLERLEKAEKTESDHACPHGVQFYDVVIDGARHERAAKAPRTGMLHVARRFGFGTTWKSARPAPYFQAGTRSSAASAVMRASSSATNAA